MQILKLCKLLIEIEDGKKPERAMSIRPLTLLARLQVNRGYFDEAISHCDLSLKIFRQNIRSSRYKLNSVNIIMYLFMGMLW